MSERMTEKRLTYLLSGTPTLTIEICRELLQALKAERERVKELEARIEWQPIETAPKDGTRLLTIVTKFPNCRPAIGWWNVIADKWMASDAEDFHTEEDWQIELESTFYEPTHWMPLPEPPKERKV